MPQLTAAVNASIATRGRSRRRRQTAWRLVREQIERTQHRNHKARESDHKRVITRLRARGIILECCRCCFLGNRL